MAFNKNNSKFVPRKILEVVQVDSNNNTIFTLGEGTISNGKITVGGEETVKTDANGSTMFAIPKGKTCEASFDVHVQDIALIAAMNGTSRKIGTNDTKIRTPKIETVEITATNLTSVVLEKSVVNDGTGGTPLYNIALSVLTADGSFARSLTQGAVVDTDIYTYTSGTKTLTFEADTLSVGDVIRIVYWYENADAVAVSVKANEYPVAAKMLFRVEGCMVCTPSELIDVYYEFPAALLSTENELDMGDPEAVVTVKATCFYSYCGVNKDFYTITLADD